MAFEFVEWKKHENGCVAIFQDAAQNILTADLACVNKVYWDNVEKSPVGESQPMAGITFEQSRQALAAMSRFGFTQG